MCYSAIVEQELKSLRRKRSPQLDLPGFAELLNRRLSDDSIKIAKAFEANFANPDTPAEQKIKSAIDEYNKRLSKKWETALFSQKKRLANAERALNLKETKKALEDQRISTNKIAWHQKKLADLKRTKLEPKDSRIFPFWYAPVVIVEEGKYVIRLMRYHCRPNGKPAWYDKRYDGLYNARRDNLEGFWKNQFGQKHGFFVATSFYENVALHDFEKRKLRPDEEPQNVILHFNPQPTTPMILACLWDHWQAPGKPDLYSFAAITDEPPPEVAATGHNRCVIPLKASNLDIWMNPAGRDKAELYSVLDDRERPYYEHRMAA